MSKIRTKEQILDRNGFDFEAFKNESFFFVERSIIELSFLTSSLLSFALSVYL